MLQLDIILGLVLADFIMFMAILAYVRRLWTGIQAQLAAITTDPEAMRNIGMGLAAGWKASADGKAGKDKQVTRNQERKLMTFVLKDYMNANAPLVKMLMDRFPETWQAVQQEPELAFIVMAKAGPMLEAQAQKGLNNAMGGLEKAVGGLK